MADPEKDSIKSVHSSSKDCGSNESSKHIQLYQSDAGEQLKIEIQDNSNGVRTPNSAISTHQFGRRLISFSRNDPDNPYNWTSFKKAMIVLVSVIVVLNSTMGSSLAANIGPYISKQWDLHSTSLLILVTSIYLIGYVLGPLLWGPASETYGRKYVMVWAFSIFTIFTMACALAPNYAALLIFRFFCGVSAACPISVVGGTCADIYKDPQSRGRAMAIFMAATTFGPVFGPIVSGFISPISWRWSFWVGLILAGATWIPLILVPETYGPTILKHKAELIRKTPGNENFYAPIELEKTDIRHILTVVLTRPLRMFFFEALVFFTCIYLSFTYAIFYLFFQCFPIIYEDIYGFSAGEEGLTFIAIGVGAVFACGVYLLWDAILRRARAADAPWVRKEEMRRLPMACVAGPFAVAAYFWMGWSARPDIHWIVPTLAGIPFGFSFLLMFMAMLNYLVDAYQIFAASAMAAAGTSRSLWGAALPFATRSMYDALGVPWACSLLGFISLAMSVIPFVFIWKGDQIRARSKFCQYLLKKEQEEEEKIRREQDMVAEEPN